MMKSLYLGYSLREVNDIKDKLDTLGIQYRQKVKGRDTGLFDGSNRGHYGSFGVNNDFETQYEIFVKNKDYDKAIYQIRKL